MTDEMMALLEEALDFLNDRPGFSLRRDRRRTSYKLAARLDAFLQSLRQSPHLAIDEARDRWAHTSFLRIDPDERIIRSTPEGTWVRGWILIENASLGDVEPELRERYERTLEALPYWTKQAFLAHCRGGLPYERVAESLGMTVPEVQQHVAAALASLFTVLDTDRTSKQTG